MLSIICENCKETYTTGSGRWIATNGTVQFYCATCEGTLLQAFVKNQKPKTTKPKARAPANGAGEVLVKNAN